MAPLRGGGERAGMGERLLSFCFTSYYFKLNQSRAWQHFKVSVASERVACGMLREMKTIKGVAEGGRTSCLWSIPAGRRRDGEEKEPAGAAAPSSGTVARRSHDVHV